MALTDENNGGVGTTMLVSPTGNNGGFGGFGGDWSALLIIFLLCMFGGGWGMGGFGGGMMWPMMMGGFGGGFGLDYLYPWLNNSQHISDGFRDQYLNTQIGDLRTDVNRGFGDVQLGIAGINQNLCQTGNNVVNAVNGAQNAISQQLYSNELYPSTEKPPTIPGGYSYAAPPEEEASTIDYDSDTVFGKAVDGKETQPVMAIMDDLMTLLQSAQPRLHRRIVREIENL